jgi:hypothetical protein
MRALMMAALLAACGQTTTPPTPKTPVAPAAGATAAWDGDLLAMLPFIDACIARSPDTKYVTYAARSGEALVLVRLNGPNGPVDCSVPDDDPTPTHATITPRNADLVIEGESAAVFVRGPGENPGGECYEAPEVRGPNNEVLGWMADPEGC